MVGQLMNKKLERILKEMLMAKFKVLPQHVLGWIKKNQSFIPSN
jgi:hypothetical protein